MPKGLLDHQKKARKRIRAGLRPEASRARERALRDRLEERRNLARRVDRPARSRSEIVAERDKERVERRAAEPRFKDKETVDRGTAYRTAQRVERLGGLPKGVNAADGLSGAEARHVKGLLREKKQFERQQRGLSAVPTPTKGAPRPRPPQPGDRDPTMRELAEKRVQRLHTPKGGGMRVPLKPGPYARIARPRRRRKAA